MNLDPELYHRYNGPQQVLARQLLSETQFRRAVYPRIVDVGCGTGEVTNLILEKFSRADVLEAFDKAQEMLDFAIVHSPRDHLVYSRGEIDVLETLNPDWLGSFDLLTCFMVLHWVKDQPKGLSNISALVKPGGEILLALSTGPPATFLKLGHTLRNSPRWKEYLEKFNPPKRPAPFWEADDWWSTKPDVVYSAICEQAGIEVLQCRVLDQTYTCKDNDECKGMLETLLPHVRIVPQHLRADFMEDALSIFLEHCKKSPDGKPTWEARLLSVHGLKK